MVLFSREGICYCSSQTVLAWCRRIAQRRGMPWALWPLHFSSGKSCGCVLHSLGWAEKVLVTPASQVMSKQRPNCGKVFSELILLWTLVSIWHSYWVAESAFDNNLLFVNPRKAEVNSTEQAQTKTDSKLQGSWCLVQEQMQNWALWLGPISWSWFWQFPDSEPCAVTTNPPYPTLFGLHLCLVL